MMHGRISAPLNDSRRWGREGRQIQPPRRGPPARTDSGPWVPLDSHMPSHVNARNTHQGTCATQHRQTRGSRRSDVTLGGCPCPATPQGRHFPALRPLGLSISQGSPAASGLSSLDHGVPALCVSRGPWSRCTTPKRQPPGSEIWGQTHSPGNRSGIQVSTVSSKGDRPWLLGCGRRTRKSRTLCPGSYAHGLHTFMHSYVCADSHRSSMQARGHVVGGNHGGNLAGCGTGTGVGRLGPSLSSRVAHCSTSRLPGGCGGPGGLKLRTSW